MVQNPKYWRAKELPQVDSLIVLVMTRYIGTTKKLKRAKTPEAPSAQEPEEVVRRTLRKSSQTPKQNTI